MAIGAGEQGSVVTVGSFDGVHLGHQAVLDEIVQRARASGRTSVVVTFEPHPLAVVNPAAAPLRLTTADERLEALAPSGVDRLMVLRFDRTMASLPPERFVDEVLLRRCRTRELVIGYDHGFGKGRTGDVATLRTLGEARGFTVDVVPAVQLGATTISSTAVRRAIAGGDLGTAARMLGHRYTVTGKVLRGEQRGRTIGVPTANLAPPSRKLLPPDGVYAVWVETPEGRFGGMMNQGPRPTFDDGRRVLEAHLFGFEGDLYDRVVRVTWLAHLRDIRRFNGVAALQAQLERDREGARAVLARAHLDLDASVGTPE